MNPFEFIILVTILDVVNVWLLSQKDSIDVIDDFSGGQF